MQADGFTLDQKRTECEENDIPDILERFDNLSKEIVRERTEKSFMVPAEEIRKNGYDLSIGKYKKVIKKELVFRPSAEILNDLSNLNEEISRSLKDLMGIIGK